MTDPLARPAHLGLPLTERPNRAAVVQLGRVVGAVVCDLGSWALALFPAVVGFVGGFTLGLLGTLVVFELAAYGATQLRDRLAVPAGWRGR